jgi:hypothetical protein
VEILPIGSSDGVVHFLTHLHPLMVLREVRDKPKCAFLEQCRHEIGALVLQRELQLHFAPIVRLEVEVQ